MVPLDVTHQALMNQPLLDSWDRENNEAAQLLYALFSEHRPKEVERFGDPALNLQPLHDSHALTLLLRPDLYAGHWMQLSISIQDDERRGRCEAVLDTVSEGALGGVFVMIQVNAAGFLNDFSDTVKQFEL